MQQIDLEKLSTGYSVRRLEKADVPSILSLCGKNKLYYEYCPPFVTEQSILDDMTALPPGTTSDDKYYVGFFDGNKLVAVLDLISGYPEKDTAYIGFFMTDVSVQCKGIGSRIIKSVCLFLCGKGFSAIRLCWVQGNPQAEHFWHKNGFVETGKIYKRADIFLDDAVKHMILPVSEENIAVAARIHSLSWQESHRAFCSEDFIAKHTPEHQEEYIRRKIDQGSEFFILNVTEAVAVISVTGDLIEDLYVLPEQHDQGFGTALLRYSINLILERGLIPTLWILENNQGAARLYGREGFRPSGRRKHISDKIDEIEFIFEKRQAKI